MGSATLADVMDELDRRGFTEHFMPVSGGLRAINTAKTFPPSQVLIAEYHRFEGVSDPDDMAIVYAIETGNGLRGTLVDAFGVYSDPRLGDVIDDVPIHRRRDRLRS
jgi:hypothetical protein